MCMCMMHAPPQLPVACAPSPPTENNSHHWSIGPPSSWAHANCGEHATFGVPRDAYSSAALGTVASASDAGLVWLNWRAEAM